MKITSVSVVIPTYNDARRLSEALKSIVDQTYKPDEIIVSDDASSDATVEIVRKTANHSIIPIRYLRLDAQTGVVAARNQGIRAARGEWIANCDSDDTWLPNKLERQVQFISDWRGSPLAILGTYGYNVNDRGRTISRVTMGPDTEEQYLALKRAGALFYLLHASIVFPKAAYEVAGGYTTEYGAAEDCDFWMRMSDLGIVIALNEPLVHYRKRLGSTQLARFTDNREGLERLGHNRRRAIRGEIPLSRQAFHAKQAALPIRDRLKRRRLTLGTYYFRLGAARAVNGQRLRGAAQLSIGATLDPPLVFAGIKATVRQKLSSRMAR